MIEYIESSNKPLGILAWHPDRLARNSVDGGKIIYLIDINRIASLRFPQFWFEPTPQGKFMLQILSPTPFEAVQKVLTSRKKPRKSKIALPFAFTGFAKYSAPC